MVNALLTAVPFTQGRVCMMAAASHYLDLATLLLELSTIECIIYILQNIDYSLCELFGTCISTNIFG